MLQIKKNTLKQQVPAQAFTHFFGKFASGKQFSAYPNN